jgi:hypothetical protein
MTNQTKDFDTKLLKVIKDNHAYGVLIDKGVFVEQIKELVKSEMEKVIGKDLKGMTNRGTQMVLNDLKRILRERLSDLLK